MAKTYDTAYFIERAIKVHGDRYCYSIAHYTGINKNISVICLEHGAFKQMASVHLRGSGCPDCAGFKKLGLSGFIEKAKKVHGDKYCYQDVIYKDVDTKVKLYCKPCDNHFEQTVVSHLKGSSCPKCRVKPKIDTKEFIRRSVAANGDKYTYEKTVYVRASDKLVITCKKHGDFLQQANSHYQGAQCPECVVGLQGWGRQDYVDACQSNNGMSAIYLIKCKGNNELFYKIGVTSIGLRQRFKSSEMPYDYEPIFFIEGEAGYIWDLELALQQANKKTKYKPELDFGGYTECFSSVSEKTKALLKKLASTNQIQLIA